MSRLLLAKVLIVDSTRWLGGRGLGLLFFACLHFIVACSDLVRIKVLNEGDFVFEGVKSLKARPDDGTWILRWDAIPAEDVSYEVFRREIPPAGAAGLSEAKPYDFESPAALTNDDYYISESLLIKNNTCFLVRVKYPGYKDSNTKELCTGHTPAVGAIGISKPPVFVSLSFVNAALDKRLNAIERTMDSQIVLLQATDFSTSKYAFVSGSADASACSALPSDAYTDGIPLAKDSRLAIDGSYKVCVELDNSADAQVYGMTAEALTVDTTAVVNGLEALPTFTSLNFVGAAADGYLNASEKSAETNIAILNASGFVTAQYLVASSTADCSAQTYSSTTLPKSNHADLTEGSKKLCVMSNSSIVRVAFHMVPLDMWSSIQLHPLHHRPHLF